MRFELVIMLYFEVKLVFCIVLTSMRVNAEFTQTGNVTSPSWKLCDILTYSCIECGMTQGAVFFER